jgi:hypothetical protein
MLTLANFERHCVAIDYRIIMSRIFKKIYWTTFAEVAILFDAPRHGSGIVIAACVF